MPFDSAMISLSPTAVAQGLAALVRERLCEMAERFFPAGDLPDYLAGYPIGGNERADLAFVLMHLYEWGDREFMGRPLTDWLSALLARGIHGPSVKTFYSYRIAETLAAFGPFASNPLLASFTPAQVANLALAVDSTDVCDLAGQSLKGLPNNYWAVLARCEVARQKLGLLADDRYLTLALARTEACLSRNPLGFFDDSHDFSQRYDLYSWDTHLFCEPFWERLPPAMLRHNLAAHTAAYDRLVMPNGALVAWGRSIGALSVCMTMEYGALALHHGLASQPARTLALVAHALNEFRGWYRDGLIAAHRGRMTFGYRGPHRLLQMSLDCLGKVIWAALQLRQVAETPLSLPAAELWPPLDELLPLDQAGAAVWLYRSPRLAFQMPLLGREAGADYQPWVHAPGLLDTPVDTPLRCGVPRLRWDQREYGHPGVPLASEKTPGGLRLRFGPWRALGTPDAAQQPPRAGERLVHLRVVGPYLAADENWQFTEAPEALSWMVPEVVPLRLDLGPGTPAREQVVTVAGMPPFRSFWSEFSRVRELQFTPASSVTWQWRLGRAPRVQVIPGDHDYTQALYGAMPANSLVWRPHAQQIPLAQANWDQLLGDADILHLGWPEHLFHPGTLDAASAQQRILALLAELARRPIKVVWTMHNRLPHRAEGREWGAQLYRALAPLVHGVIHHSAWGERLMRAELPFRADARHVVVPHGHYGDALPPPAARAAIEAELGLPPCTQRFGVLGRPQAEKQVDLIIRAFIAAARPDQQLLVGALDPASPLPSDPRVIVLPRTRWLPRAELARQTRVCDALVSAHTGPTYLTSGLVADALGAGLPMLVPPWPFFQETLGPAALDYDGSEAGLQTAFAQLRDADLARAKTAALTRQPLFAWPRLANLTLTLLDQLYEQD